MIFEKHSCSLTYCKFNAIFFPKLFGNTKIIGIKTIAYFSKSDFVWKRNGRYEVDIRFKEDLEIEFGLNVKRVEIVEYYSDNTSSPVEFYDYP